METKKKLRKDLEEQDKCLKSLALALTKQEFSHHEDYNNFSARLAAIEKKLLEDADLIPAREAAKMLGYKSNFISSRLLTQKGIEHRKNEYGLLQISRKSVEQYLESRKTTNED